MRVEFRDSSTNLIEKGREGEPRRRDSESIEEPGRRKRGPKTRIRK